MKKVLSFVLLTSLSFGYEACGTTKKDALNNLSQSIYVNVDNKFQKNERVSSGGFDTKVSKNITNESIQTSSLTLKNVSYFYKNNLVCAKVSKQDVQSSAKEDLKFLLAFNISDLPQNFLDKQKMITNTLTKINFVKAILQLTPTQIYKLTKLEKQLKDLSTSGEVVFNTNIPNAKVKISGINKTFAPSTPIELPAGEYSYTITAKGKCPITGNFTIKPKQNFTINKDLGDYPVLTFISNQNNTRVKVNGNYVRLNSPYKIDQCNGKVIWNMSFENQSESGEVEVSPNYKDTIERDFTPKVEIKKLKQKIDYYTNSKEVNINYGYAFAHKKEWDKEKRIEIRKFNNYGIYKLGFGILGGTQTSWTAKNMNELELTVSFKIQLPSINDYVFHIYKMPVIPSFGIEGGWDIYKFIDNGDYAVGDITSVLRGSLGVTFLLHKQFGINIEYSRGMLDKKDNIISGGLVFDF